MKTSHVLEVLEYEANRKDMLAEISELKPIADAHKDAAEALRAAADIVRMVGL